MSEQESIKEELSILREEYKNLFLLFLATITGSITSFYQVITSRVELFVIIISIVGFVISLVLMKFLKKTRMKMDTEVERLKELQ